MFVSSRLARAVFPLLALATVAGCASVESVTETASLAELEAPPVARVEGATLHLTVPGLRDERSRTIHPSVEVEGGRIVVAGRKPRNVTLRRTWSFDLGPLGYSPDTGSRTVFWRDPDGTLVPLPDPLGGATGSEAGSS